MRSTGGKGTTGCSKQTVTEHQFETSTWVNQSSLWRYCMRRDGTRILKSQGFLPMQHGPLREQCRDSLSRQMLSSNQRGGAALSLLCQAWSWGPDLLNSAFHVLACFSERLATSTAFLVRWVKGGCAKARGRKSQGCAWLQESLSYWPLTSIMAAAEERSSCHLL